MHKIYCLGETVYDIIFKNGTPIAAKAGGSMLNSTVSMGKINLPVYFISEYGTDDIGNEIDAFLKSSDVNTQYVYRYEKGKTSIAIAFLNEHNNANYTFYKDLPEKRLDIEFPTPEAGDIVLFGSYYGINKEIRKQISGFVENAKKAGSLIIYDPNFRNAHLHELRNLLPLIIENMKLANIVRGSDEDFQMICNASSLEEAFKFVSQFCPLLIYTKNADGVHLRNNVLNLIYKVPKINPISTIGAGDNFNAGLIYGLGKEKISCRNIQSLDPKIWQKVVHTGISFASDVCMSYDNYISDHFAAKIRNSN
jgi:fructokinase